jgi:hypothetical protein
MIKCGCVVMNDQMKISKNDLVLILTYYTNEMKKKASEHLSCQSSYTFLLIKLTKRHARCTRNKLAVLQHKNFAKILSWSSAFYTCKHDLNRAISDVDYQVWNESFFKSWDFDVLRQASTKNMSKFVCLLVCLIHTLFRSHVRACEEYLKWYFTLSVHDKSKKMMIVQTSNRRRRFLWSFASNRRRRFSNHRFCHS